MAKRQDLLVFQGDTWVQPVRWEIEPIVFKAISGISKVAPAAIHVPAHGLVDGWKVVVVSAVGMTEINAENDPPKSRDYRSVTVVDADNLTLNGVDASSYSTYVSGGYVQYNTPMDMAGYTARMTVRDVLGGTELLSLTTENSRIVIDDLAKTIRLTLTAATTAAITWTNGVYDLELISPAGAVTTLLYGAIEVTNE